MHSHNDHLDTEAITSYLEAHIEGFRGPIVASKFATGQSNPTFRLDTLGGSYVLRRKPPGKLLESAHAIDREFRVLEALQDSDVPVPRTYVLCEDNGVVGTSFFVMSMIEGRNLVDPRVPELGEDRAGRRHLYNSMNRVLAAIHSVDIAAAKLEDFGKSGNYLERQVVRWSRQHQFATTRKYPEMDRLIAWLEKHSPDDDGRVALVHGDYRIDNLIFSSNDTSILAVLDWELATLGHPHTDLAYQCMQWRMPVNAPLQGLEGIDRATLGIPDEESYIAQYCDRMGIAEIDNWPFHLVLSFFRLAVILEGVAKRATDGNASNPMQAQRFGSMVPLLVERAVQLIEQ
jgi:aminoglycoside phosphotransferase (APT) family kinase protein